MKTLENIALDPVVVSRNLDELEALLSNSAHLKERDHLLPFFKARPHLCAALGLLYDHIGKPDLWASELQLFGDFGCDFASGDSVNNAFMLIELEDALEHSIFSPLPPGKTIKQWARRFEHGFSQLVDWAWNLETTGLASDPTDRVFGARNPSLYFLLIIGRNSDLTAADRDRLRWRARHVSLGAFRMSCFTFDDILSLLRERVSWAAQFAKP